MKLLQKTYCLVALVLLLFSCGQTGKNAHTDNARNADNKAIMRIAVTSATHIGFLSELGETDKVVAVTNKALIYTPLPDSVIDLGDGFSPNLEQIAKANVDVVLVCSFPGNQLETQLARLGIRSVAVNDWQESTPLRRAEWIKQFGDLLGCREKADSIYAEVESRYNALVAENEGQKMRVSIMSGMNFRGTWYVPSGNTYMGHLFKDAGADYPYYDDPSEGSIPLTLESSLASFRNADVWVGSEAKSLQELAESDRKHTWFKAWKSGRVYNWQAQANEQGANNFWERGTVHPEEILEDLINILADSTDVSFHYAKRLQ